MEVEGQLRVPDAPTLRGSLRGAAEDFYYNSGRLVAANVVWGVLLLVALLLPMPWPLRFLLLALLAIPTAGLFHLAARIVRGDSAALGDAFSAYRAYLAPAFLIGVAATALTTVFVVNALTGLASGSPIGIAFATVSGWSVIFLLMFLVAAWPVLVDPRRSDLGVRARVRLAGLLALAFPLRIGALTFLCILILVASAILFAALVTISLAFIALLCCRYVLPAADRLEGRATYLVPE